MCPSTNELVTVTDWPEFIEDNCAAVSAMACVWPRAVVDGVAGARGREDADRVSVGVDHARYRVYASTPGTLAMLASQPA